MLARYKIYRGKRPPSDPRPAGVRQDTRWRTKHPLRPGREIVAEYLACPTDETWQGYSTKYVALLEERFRQDPAPFDRLAALAMKTEVFLGCSCPTKINPTVDRCHTVLALQFMKEKYPRLEVSFPEHARPS